MKNFKFLGVLFAIFTVASPFYAQAGKETFTGTLLSYGTGFNTRASTNLFKLDITNQTSDADAQRYLSLLASGGQNDLLDAIKDENVGRFSISGRLGPRVNIVREKETDGKRHIYIVFERWMGFGELRGGYRSTDYPFTYIELLIDPRTGRGEGTYIAAAQIRWKKDKDTGVFRVEVEDFATFPSRLLNVRTKVSPR